MEAKHSPLPWHKDIHNNIFSDDVTVATAWGTKADGRPDTENAALIVDAVNNIAAVRAQNAELVEACKRTREFLREQEEVPSSCARAHDRMLDKVLAKAGSHA